MIRMLATKETRKFVFDLDRFIDILSDNRRQDRQTLVRRRFLLNFIFVSCIPLTIVSRFTPRRIYLLNRFDVDFGFRFPRRIIALRQLCPCRVGGIPMKLTGGVHRNRNVSVG